MMPIDKDHLNKLNHLKLEIVTECSKTLVAHLLKHNDLDEHHMQLHIDTARKKVTAIDDVINIVNPPHDTVSEIEIEDSGPIFNDVYHDEPIFHDDTVIDDDDVVLSSLLDEFFPDGH